MDNATMHWILTQLHLTIRLMDILTVLLNFDWQVKQILGVQNQVMDGLSCHADFRQVQCNSMALSVTAAREWIDDIKVGIIDDECFGPIAHCLANPSPHPLPYTAFTKECTLWVSAQSFDLEENALLWLCGNVETKQQEKNATAKIKDEDEMVDITLQAKEQEEDRKAEKSGQLCIAKKM